MAKGATTVVEKPNAPPAEPEEEFEALLPDLGEERPVAERDDEEPEPEPVPAATVEPAKDKPKPKVEPVPVEEAVVVETGKKSEPLSPAAREERAKRKMYAKKWETAIGERDVALAEIDRLKGKGASPAEKQYLDDLRRQADEADSMGKLMELSLREMDRRDRLWTKQLVEMDYTHKIALSQINARITHKDFDDVLQKAGIYDAIRVDSQGNWADQDLGRRIYFTRDGKLRADPAEEAYQLALGKVEYEASLRGEEESPKKPDLKVVPKAQAPVKPEEEALTVADAERRGAQTVIDKVVENQNRPKGIRNLRSAGTPGTARFTRTQLDALAESDPQGYLALMKKNPQLERFHLGG